jgi:hypothetical protein
MVDQARSAPLPQRFDQVMALFNAGEFRACVDPLEELFFADRNTFYQGLLHLVVALLQTRLGLVRGPRIRFGSATELLAPYTPWHRGIDVEALLEFIHACRRQLPEGVIQIPADEAATLALPTYRLHLVEPPGGN